MSTYRAAVIGLGRMGSTFDDEMTRGGSLFLPYCHGPAYVYSQRTELVAGADIHDEQRSIFGERWGLSDDHMYSDYEEMLDREKPDIVSVCTTARIRADVVQKVARAGVKAIWAEKPISISLAEADEMVRVCAEEGVSLAVNCARRWNPFLQPGSEYHRRRPHRQSAAGHGPRGLRAVIERQPSARHGEVPGGGRRPVGPRRDAVGRGRGERRRHNG